MTAPDLYKLAPLDHQLAALKKAKGKRGFMYSCEQGTGKTWIAINEHAQAWGEGKINGWIVFAPNGVHTNWVEVELPKIMPDWVRWRAKAWNADAGKAEMDDFLTIMSSEGNDSSELRIMTMNWEGLTFPRSLDIINRFMRSVTKLAITGDESQDIANPQAKRVKNLLTIRMAAVLRRTMSGTPVLKAPFDLFSQYSFLDPTILGTTSFFAFKTEYADMMDARHPMIVKLAQKTKGGRIPQIVASDPITGLPRYKNLSRLEALIEPYTFRVLKADCLDLPPKTYTQSFFEMLPSQRIAYRKMEKEFRYIVGSDESAVTKLAALGKLCQISSGFLIETSAKTTHRLLPLDENPKIKLLRARLQEVVLENNQQVIIWASYREEIAQIAELCAEEEISHTIYNGDTKSADRTAHIANFQAGKTQAFIVQQAAGSTGITLTAASYVFYYSNTFNSGDRWQSEDRAHRIGQTKSVTYEDLVGKGTRDLRIVESLRAKKDLAAIINGDVRMLLNDE